MFFYVLALPYAIRWLIYIRRDIRSLIISFASLFFVFASKTLLFFIFSSPFSLDEGAQKCYSERGRDIVLLERGESGCGIDPVTGRQTREVTPEVMETLRRKERPAARIILDGGPVQFFDNATGKAIVWYDRGSDGSFQLFDGDGTNPETGRPLRPVTPDIVAEITRRNEDMRRSNAEVSRPVGVINAASIGAPVEPIRAASRPLPAESPSTRSTSSRDNRRPSTSSKPTFVHEAVGNDADVPARAPARPLRIETPLEGQ